MKFLIKLFVLLIIIGLIAGAVGVAFFGVDIANLNDIFIDDSAYTQKEKQSAVADTIKIDTENNIIKFIASQDEFINVEYYESENYVITYTDSENSINIEGRLVKKLYFFNLSRASQAVRTITVAIPTEFSGDIDITTSNGSVVIENEVDLDNVKIVTNNGGITLKNIKANDIYAKTNNGNIVLSQVECSTKIQTDTSNGKITMENVISSEINAKTSNGAIVLNNINADKMECRTSNGNINASKIESDEITLISSNQSIFLTITGSKDDYKAVLSTSNGSISYDGVNVTNQTLNDTGAKYVKAQTSNGNITINYELK